MKQSEGNDAHSPKSLLPNYNELMQFSHIKTEMTDRSQQKQVFQYGAAPLQQDYEPSFNQ